MRCWNGGAWNRVIYGGKTAIEHACDPNTDAVEWHPKYKRAVDAIDAGKHIAILTSIGGVPV